MKYIDIHTHLNLSAFESDCIEVIERTQSENVWHINVGTQESSSKRAVEIAEKYEEGVYATIGLHPVQTFKAEHDEAEVGEGGKQFTSRGEVFNPDFYRALAKSEKVVAIGECGLDYYRLDVETANKQREAFIAQIRLANELQLPLMLHVRAGSEGDAYGDVLTLLKQEAKVLGNVHFFAGTLEEAQRFWEMGFTTSFTGVITFTHDYDEVIKNAPLNMLHAETDAPYVTPVPFRGERNEPMHVKEVYRKIAEIRGEDEEMVREQLLKNAARVFEICQ